MTLWDTITNFIPPLKTATELFNVATGKESITTAQQKIGTSLAITGGTATIGYLGPSAIVGTSTATKIGLAVASPAIIGATASAIENPEPIVKAGGKFISSSFDFGRASGELILDPSLNKTKEVATEYPIQSAAIIGLAGYGATKLIGNAYSNFLLYQNTQQMQKNTKQMMSSASDFAPNSIQMPTNLPSATNKYDVQVIEEQAKAQQKLTESQTKAQLDILDAQTKQQKELLGQQIELQRLSSQSSPVATATVSSPVAVKATKKKKKTTKKKQAKKKPIKKKKSKKTSKSSKKRKI